VSAGRGQSGRLSCVRRRPSTPARRRHREPAVPAAAAATAFTFVRSLSGRRRVDDDAARPQSQVLNAVLTLAATRARRRSLVPQQNGGEPEFSQTRHTYDIGLHTHIQANGKMRACGDAGLQFKVKV